jgi:hypothetical protein
MPTYAIIGCCIALPRVVCCICWLDLAGWLLHQLLLLLRGFRCICFVLARRLPLLLRLGCVLAAQLHRLLLRLLVVPAVSAWLHRLLLLWH